MIARRPLATELCRICDTQPATTHGACEKCYIEECEESDEPCDLE